jgi:DNA-binding transcriptional LysR family regulator
MLFYPLLSAYPQEIIFRTFIFHRYQPLFPNSSMEFVASTLLPQTLVAYCHQYSDVQVEIRPGDTAELTQAVLERQIDAAIVADAPADERLLPTLLRMEETCLVSAAYHSPIRSANELKTPTLLTFGTGCAFRALFE